jgi:hypothetical protein
MTAIATNDENRVPLDPVAQLEGRGLVALGGVLILVGIYLARPRVAIEASLPPGQP